MASRKDFFKAKRTKTYEARNKLASVRFEDEGLKALALLLFDMKQMKVRVGVLPPASNKRYPGGTKVSKVAATLEFGTEHAYSKTSKNIPPRSFIRAPTAEGEGLISSLTEAQLRDVINGTKTPIQALSEVAGKMLDMYKRRLASAVAWAAPLDPETVERKGHAIPLHETGVLMQSLSWSLKQGAKLLARGS
jgi:hypothetical protein